MSEAWQETAFGNFYHERYGLVVWRPTDPVTWEGYSATVPCEERKPLGPFDSAEAAQKALEDLTDA